MSDEVVLLQRLPEGESGKIIGCLTAANIEAIAAVYALPTEVRKRKIGNDDAVVRHLAGRLGISPALVRRARRDKRVRKLRDEILTEAIEALMPDLAFMLVQHAHYAKDPEKPIMALARIFTGRLREAGVNVNLNSNNNTLNVNVGDGISEDRENLLWLREMMESGQAERLVAAMKAKEAVHAEAEIVQNRPDPA